MLLLYNNIYGLCVLQSFINNNRLSIISGGSGKKTTRGSFTQQSGICCACRQYEEESFVKTEFLKRVVNSMGIEP
jgi:hypothetical protein